MSGAVSGIGDLQRALDTLERRMCNRVAKKAVLAGAKVIAKAMAAGAPVQTSRKRKGKGGTPLDPGDIKADIKARNSTKDGEIAALAGPQDTAFVANWVEFGHRQVTGGYSKIVDGDGNTRGPGTQVGEVQPDPFLRPAFDASVEAAEDARDEVLREGLEGKD